MPFRVLHIATYMGRGGLETFLMNVYRNIDREKIQFDFLVHRDFRADYDDEIEALGGRIHRLPRLNPFDPGYRKALMDFFIQHPEYKIVHSHLDCMSSIPLSAAKKASVPVRIAHSHNSNQDKNLKYPLKLFYMRKIPKYATDLFACSKSAGDWMFPGQKVSLVKNGIETERFAFNLEIRLQVRQELGLGTDFVLGHVGRFMPQKNHSFLIDVFAEIQKRLPDAKLMLVGEGPLEADIREKVRKLGMEDVVMFLGVRADVDRLLQAMDVFLLPSLYEGLGMVAVEAQCSGLPCTVSDRVPTACKMTDDVAFLPLNRPEEWSDTILSIQGHGRESQKNRIQEAGYDIGTTANWLQEFYLEKFHER